MINFKEKTEKIKLEFINNTRSEYRNSSRVHRYCIVEEVNKTDGNFIKIGERPQIEKELFAPRSNWTREIIGLGRNIAIGEEKYFINNILNNVTAEEIQDINLRQEDIANQLGRLGQRPLENSIILGSLSYVYKKLGHDQNWVQWDNEFDCFCLTIGVNKIPIYSIGEQFIGSNLILLNKNAILWKYNVDSDGERLYITIKEKAKDPWKYDIIVYIIFKQILDISRIKVIKIV